MAYNSSDNILLSYIDYIRENQRIYRYIVENCNDNERVIANIVENRYLNRERRNINYDRSRRNYDYTNTRRRYTDYINSRQRVPNNTPHLQARTTFLPPNFFSPVTVRPTQDDISQSTRNMYFSDISLNDRHYTRCPITLSDFSENSIITRINNCGHYFSEEGIRRHFLSNVNCPCCRYDIRRNNNINISDISNNIQETIISAINETLNSSNIRNYDIDLSNNNTVTLSYSIYAE